MDIERIDRHDPRTDAWDNPHGPASHGSVVALDVTEPRPSSLPGIGAWRMVAGEYADEVTVETYIGTEAGAHARADSLTAARAEGDVLSDGRRSTYARDMIAVRIEPTRVSIDLAVLQAAQAAAG